MYDAIILGAGSAGCVLANRLSADPARKVLVLEAGGQPSITSRMPSDWVALFNTHEDWGYHTVPQAGCRGRRIFWPRGKMVGGSGSMNAMIYIRGLPYDFDRWEALGNPGWGWKDVFEDFKSFEGNKDIQDEFHGNAGPLHVQHPEYLHPYEQAYVDAGVNLGYPRNDDYNGASQEGFGFFQFTIREGERSGTGRAYLKPAMERENLTLKTGVLLTGLIVEKGRVKGVRYLENGVPGSVETDGEVFLTAGAIGSAQLMLLSGVGPADELKAVGVDPVHDLPGVGKNLVDHINIPFSYYTKENEGIGAWTAEDLAASQKEWEESKTGIRASAWVAASAHVRSRPDVEPDLQFYGAVSPQRDYGRFLASKAGFTFHCTLQRPESVGEITLRTADPVAYPLIDPKYFTSDPTGQDIATLIRGIRIQREVAATDPLASLLDGEMQPSAECRTDEELEHYIRGHCTTLYHASGTCKMGRDEMAVVDPETFRVHGLEGLRICDASLFPKMISGNINTTTVLFAERCARAAIGG
ncbi:GMC family oxidoreductase [Albimonas pacifica]|uniref:Choline dehydrogenase n=1 Tax=Albimonas pacifica TaxID=1114924 RepID=A0A1I3BN38_9RHOB|nr:GMC family oxidoreductase N-terminal domain-containing protein [Albimonas pacifica]SFH63682.1 choline dehydrogenase [Albimonas pacifica]